jgi:hypothetical protein
VINVLRARRIIIAFVARLIEGAEQLLEEPTPAILMATIATELRLRRIGEGQLDGGHGSAFNYGQNDRPDKPI